MIYTMKQACAETGLSYDTLKFYCNQGLIPHVQRDQNNRRIFDEHNIAWIKSLSCLKNCDLSIAEIKTYLDLCLQGPSSIPARQALLSAKLKSLEQKLITIQTSIDFIHWKQSLYQDMLDGKREYYTNFKDA